MLEELIDELSSPEAYPHPAGDLQVEQTHISVVFLAGDYAYKLKKPVDLQFVDYTSFQRRLHFCELEIELNQRLAADVYLDVAAVVRENNELRIATDVEDLTADRVVEPAVRMRRLDDEDHLKSRLWRGDIPPGIFARLGRRLAEFHDEADRGPEIDEYARYEIVETNALDNFEQATDQVGTTVEPEVFDRLEQWTRRRLDEHRALFEKRADEGVARDTHGDLRLEHVYVTDGTIRVVDCIEFNEAFRYDDPVNDIAFLAMDLGFRGLEQEADHLLETYFQACGDDEGRRLVDFYVAYRSCVRAKVHGFKAEEPEVPQEDRKEAMRKSRAHWLYALSRLTDEGEGPELVMLAGLPATGKSTLGRRMVDDDRADVLIESDVVRKQLAGIDPDESADAEFGEGIYTREFSEKTYREVGRRAARHLEKGRRVAVAATFVTDHRRRQMLDRARELGVPVRFVECSVPEDIAHERLKARTDDVSDAGIDVYENLKDKWEPPSPPVARVHEVRETY